MTPEQYEETRRVFLINLKRLVAEERHVIERLTVQQADSPLWLELRSFLLTASTFSKICKRRRNITSETFIETLMCPSSLTNLPAIKHGKANERAAIEQLERQENITVRRCGIFIDEDYFFLGATPDGLYEDGLVEIKCPYSARDMDPETAISKKKILFWKADGTVNAYHDWYYQIQGQLQVCNKPYCLLAVWTGEKFPLKTVKIIRDRQFWFDKMELKLLEFYEYCFLPRILDPKKRSISN